jgi:hypothetical protein
MKITKGDIRRFGYTLGCPGCTAIAGRKSAQGHNDLCRSRIEGKLEQEEEGRARVEKRRLIIDEAVVDYHEKQMKIAHDKQEGEMKDDSSAPIDIPVERRQYNSSEQPGASKRDNAGRLDEENTPDGKRRKMIAAVNIKEGLIVDLTNEKLAGDNKYKRAVSKQIRIEKPMLVIGDETCGETSARFMIEMYREQNEQGRYFMHIKTKGEKKWTGEQWTALQNKTSAIAVNTAKFSILTNCLGIARLVNDRCKLRRRKPKSDNADKDVNMKMTRSTPSRPRANSVRD